MDARSNSSKDSMTPSLRLPASLLVAITVVLSGAPLHAQDGPTPPKPASAAASSHEHFEIEQKKTESSVVVNGRKIDYEADAGTLVVHNKDWDDVPQNIDKDEKKPPAAASMFYVAYFAKEGKERPATRS